MDAIKLLFFLFLLSAITVGVAIKDSSLDIIDRPLNNLSNQFNSFSSVNLSNTDVKDIPNIEGFSRVLNNYIRFIGTFGIETYRAGIHFGHDNPQYFEAKALASLLKLIIWAYIISLLIRPVMYLLALICLVVVGFYERKKRKQKNIQNLKGGAVKI